MKTTKITRDDLRDKYRKGLKKYRTLLSLDGGGLRGLITAQVLVELESAIKEVILQEKNVLLKNPDKIKGDATSFDIDLGDWFDQLAGTSTGGLLALYFAARGGQGKKSFVGARVGSAQNASDLYVHNGKRIFGTSAAMKAYNMSTSGGQYSHSATGLEGVLQEVFADAALSSLESSAVVTTVDVDNARTGIFFLKNSSADWHKTPDVIKRSGPDQALPVASGLQLAVKPGGQAVDHKVSGFACPLRRSHGTEVLVQATERLAAKPACEARKVGQLYLENVALKDPDAALEGCNKHGWWLPPMEMKAGLDFRIWEVARTTSAAPCFLPPVQVSPLDKAAAVRFRWPEEGIRFIDGGLANNDPTWMGLSMMLLADNRKAEEASIANTAILSIGTGTSTSCSVYQPGGQSKVPVLNIFGLLGPLIGLTMSMNGEDKENILGMLYYGLLRCPRGQYLRIQLKQAACTGADSGVPASELEGVGPSVCLTREEVAALDKMDDPKVMGEYVSIGKKLAQNYQEHLRHFVRCYVFGLDDPYVTCMPPARRY